MTRYWLFTVYEKTTMHPYVKFQKARILGSIYQTHILENSINERLKEDITTSYRDCIWLIKANSLYQKIKLTKTYASILWIYGSFLLNETSIPDEEKLMGIRYLEESITCFGILSIYDKEYYQCLSFLGHSYLDIYKSTCNISYFKKCKEISVKLYQEKSSYSGESQIKYYATNLYGEVRRLNKDIN